MTVIPFGPRPDAPEKPQPQPRRPNRDEIARTILALAVQGGSVEVLARGFHAQWPRLSAREINSGAALAHKVIEVLHGELLAPGGYGHDDGGSAA
jgi:hypothetical protein